MGLDVNSFLVVAVPIRGREDFFEKVGEARTCSEGHKPREADQKFCAWDGTPFVNKPRMCPLPAFAKAAKAEDKSPEDFYDNLMEPYDDNEPGIRATSSIQGGREASELGFGIVIPGGSLRGRSQEASLTAAKFDELRAQVEAAARAVGITGEARLFCCMRVSA